MKRFYLIGRAALLTRLVCGISVALVAVGQAGSVANAAEPPPAAVFLESSQAFAVRHGKSYSQGLLTRELFRQAVLVAAREELGLRTRDVELGDRPLGVPAELQVELACSPGQTNLIELLQGAPSRSRSVWQTELEPLITVPSLGFPLLAAQAEQLSRREFVSALQAAGAVRRDRPTASTDPLDRDLEARLANEFAFYDQYLVVRALHAEIETQGESPARLGGLIRGYANLGLVTEYYWHPLPFVFKARAMLYAQRWVAREPTSGPALWHRAYASALVGLHGWALEDLSAAEKLAATDASPRPAWTPVIEALCKYDFPRLAELREQPATAALAALLGFIAAEQEGSRNAALKVGLEAIEQLPECYRIHDSLCELSGVSAGHVVTVAGPAILAERLWPKLAQAPQLPPGVKPAIDQMKPSRGLLQRILGAAESPTEAAEIPARAKLIRALVGAAAKDDKLAADATPAPADEGEPSWAALAIMLQETTFLQVFQRVRFLKEMLAVPVDDEINATWPLVQDHRYRGFLAGMAGAPRRAPVARGAPTPRPRNAAFPPSVLAEQIQLADVQLHYDRLWKALPEPWPTFFLETAAPRQEPLANGFALCQRMQTGGGFLKFDSVLETSPHSPFGKGQRVYRLGIKSMEPAWEQDAERYPYLAAMLGHTAVRFNESAQAEKYFKIAVSLDPSLDNYSSLANVYKKQGQAEKWASTLEEFLKQPDFGLYHARVRVDLSVHYRGKKQWRVAQRHANAAAATYAAWAMVEAWKVEEGLQNWEQAETWIMNIQNRYGSTAFDWYFFCRRTGHGDLEVARRLGQAHYARSRDADFKALFDQLEGNHSQAVALYRQAHRERHEVQHLLQAALICDQTADTRQRDEILASISADRKVPVGADELQTGLRDLAEKITADLARGGKAEFDYPAFEKLRAGRPLEEQMDMTYLLAHYLSLHGQEEKALAYWKQVMGYSYIPHPCRTLSGRELLQRKVDAAEWKDSLVPPALNIDEEKFRI